VRGKGTKLGEGCPKVRLSQDRIPLPIFSQIREFMFFVIFMIGIFMFGIVSFGKSSWCHYFLSCISL
jgi:hypothetical protein